MGVWAWHRRSLDEFSDAGPQQSNAVPPECGACCGCATATRGPSRSRRGGVGGVPPGCGAGDPPGGGHTCDAAGGACERAPGHSRTSTGRRAVDGRRRRRQGGVGEGKRASDSESAPLLLPARNSTVQRIAPRPIVRRMYTLAVPPCRRRTASPGPQHALGNCGGGRAARQRMCQRTTRTPPPSIA
jgi:hypothetical protein